MEAQGIGSRLYYRQGAWMLVVGKIHDVLFASKMMIPSCSKKRRELILIVEYIENRITASQAIAILNQEVEIGKRMGVVRRVELPYTREEGIIKGRQRVRELLSAFTDEEAREIRKLRSDAGMTTKQLALRFGVHVSTIRKVLRCQ